MSLGVSGEASKSLLPPARWLRWLLAALVIICLYAMRAKIGTALAPFLYALLLAYLLAPMVAYLEKQRLSRTMAIAAVYLLLVVSLVLLGIYVIPTIVAQINSLVKQLPAISIRAQELLYELGDQYERINLPPAVVESVEASLSRLQGSLTSLLNLLGQFIVGLFSSVVFIVLVPILSFYMLKDMETIQRSLLNLFPSSYQGVVLALFSRIDTKLGAWVRGQVSISLITGGLIFVGLRIVGMDYALVLGLLVAVFNIIPYFGPLIAAVPAILLGLMRAPVLGLKVLIVQVVVQHFESSVLVPHVLGRELGLHPLLIIFALLLGAQFGGVLGMVLAAPIAAILFDLASIWLWKPEPVE